LNFEKEKLSMKHRELLNGRLNSTGTAVSEYSFSNIYLFRGSHDYEILTGGDEIFISGKTYDGRRYVMPVRDIREYSNDFLQELIETYGMLFPVPEDWTEKLDARFELNYLDGDSDYILSLDDLRTYSGKKFHSKKNLLNQFEREYIHDARRISNEIIEDAYEILESWQNNIGTDKDNTDYYPCNEALEYHNELELCGAVFYANGEPAGFLLGEELNDKVYAIHFAKGKPGIKGLYQFMYNNFAHVMPGRYCCFNFEQDLGLESLRKAKSSYKPTEMLKKYRVTLKQ